MPVDLRSRPLLTLALVGGAILLGASLRPADPSWQWRPEHLLVALALPAMVGAALVDRIAVGVWTTALLTRLVASSPTVLLHFVKPYGLMVQARGHAAPDLRYGDGYAALHGLVERLVGWDVARVHHVHLALSSLLAPLLADLVRRATGRRDAAWFAGLAAALLPLQVALAQAPTRLVPTTTLAVATGLGIMRRDRLGDALAVTCLGLVSTLRPSMLPLAAAACLALAWQARRLPALLSTAMVVARTTQLLLHLGRADQPVSPSGAVGWTPKGLAIFDVSVVPFVLTLGTLLGLVLLGGRALRERTPPPLLRPLLATSACAGATTALYGSHQLPPDQLRFVLLTLPWWIAAAAIAWAALPRVARLASLPIVGLAWYLASDPVPAWTWRTEYDDVRHAVTWLPVGSVVEYAAAADPDGSFGRWASTAGPALWMPATATPRQGTYRWVGTGDLHPDAPAPPWSRMEPVRERTVPGAWGGMTAFDAGAPYGEGSVRLGLFRVVR